MSDTPQMPPFGPDDLGPDSQPRPAGDAPLGGDSPFGDAGSTDFFGSEPAFEPALDPSGEAQPADVFFEAAETAPDPGETAIADGAMVATPDASAKSPKKKGRSRKDDKASKKRASQQLVLGVHVTPNKVYGVLVREQGGGRYAMPRRFERNRSEHAAHDFSGASTPSDLGGGLEIEDSSIQFGTTHEPDFTGESAGLSLPGDVALDAATMGQARPAEASQPIVFELRDMLEEAGDLGIDKAALAFAVAPPDVDYVELVVPDDKKKPGKQSKKKKAKKAEPEKEGAVKTDKLIALLQAAEPGEFDKDRVAFMPMTSRDGKRRFLALVPRPSDPVVPSISMLREQARHRKTQFRAIEAEVPLLMGLARLTSPQEPNENTAIVRVGAEDTLVLLLTGGVLHHVEPMQSVTAYDGPDTICSRVLLQQDVQGVGTVHNVIVLADEREDELVQGFAAFYPDARVEPLRARLADMGLGDPSPAGVEPLPAEVVIAAGAALSTLHRKSDVFEDANLLPKKLRKKKRGGGLAFAWHTLIVAVLLFMSVVFFVGLYISQGSDIAQAERRLAEFPPEAQMEVPALQMRIDSLRQVQTEITSSLGALDSLLFGTDRWSQELVRTAQAAAGSGGIWFEDWEPGAANVTVHGFATSRNRVVALAQRLQGTIEELTYQDVRDYPVYEYRISVPAPVELPQASRYLREQNGEALPPPPQLLDGLDVPAPTAAPPPAAPPAAAPPTDDAAAQ